MLLQFKHYTYADNIWCLPLQYLISLSDEPSSQILLNAKILQLLKAKLSSELPLILITFKIHIFVVGLEC